MVVETPEETSPLLEQRGVLWDILYLGDLFSHHQTTEIRETNNNTLYLKVPLKKDTVQNNKSKQIYIGLRKKPLTLKSKCLSYNNQ